MRSRIAQHQYRKRHQEKFRSSQKRAEDLETAAQHACQAFINLTGHLIRSSAIQNDQALVNEILNAAKQFCDLARVVDQDGQNSELPDPDHPLQHVTDTATVATPIQTVDQMRPTATASTQHDPNRVKRVSGFDASDRDQSYEIPVSQPPSHQILASPSYFNLEFAVSGDISSIGSRLLRMTLSSGYEALRGNPGHITDLGIRIFGLTLSFRSRDDVLSEFQWWLGPGQPLAARLKQARHYPGVPTSDTYFSVEDVAALLQDIGVVHTQDDFLEFPSRMNMLDGLESNFGINTLGKTNLQQSRMYIRQDSLPPRKESAWRSNPALQAFNFNSLMGNTAQEERHEASHYKSAEPEVKRDTRRTVPISVFLQSLANISVCLSIGPGYPQRAVKALIYASISGIPLQ